MMGRSFSLVTPNPKFSLSYSQKLKLYGLTERLTSIEAMNFPHLPDYRNAFIDPAARQRVLDEFERVARRAVEAGAEVIIPCGSHALLQVGTGVKEIDGALIMDGLAVLMKMTETAVKIQKITGTFVSRKLLYQMPGEVVREKAKMEYGIEL
jgi:Asp/Glu/hydantoin racemase